MTIRIQHRERDPICSEWDIWALGKIGRMILHLRPEEKPEDFWQPIFELGAPGHMWIDGFLSGFIPAGLEQAPASTLFMRLWRDMLEYALASEQWSHESEWWPPYLDQNWISVIGLNWLRFTEYRWSKACIPLVNSMVDMYQLWAERCLAQPSCAGVFIVFLATPAARDLRVNGLTWLVQGLGKGGRDWFDQRYLQDNLFQLLLTIWTNLETALRQDEQAWTAFFKLLDTLVTRQHRPALELQHRIGS